MAEERLAYFKKALSEFQADATGKFEARESDLRAKQQAIIDAITAKTDALINSLGEQKDSLNTRIANLEAEAGDEESKGEQVPPGREIFNKISPDNYKLTIDNLFTLNFDQAQDDILSQIHAMKDDAISMSITQQEDTPSPVSAPAPAESTRNVLVYLVPKSKTLKVYNIDTQQVSNVTMGLPTTIDNAGWTWLNPTAIILTGLRTRNKKCFVVQVEDGATTERAEMQQFRTIHATIMVGQQVFVFGGVDETTRQIDKAEVYDVNGDVWSELPNMPFASSRINAVTTSGMIYITGYELGNIVEFNPATSTYRALAMMSFMRTCKTILTTGSSLVLLVRGDYGREVNTQGAAIERLDASFKPEGYLVGCETEKAGKIYFTLSGQQDLYVFDITSKEIAIELKTFS